MVNAHLATLIVVAVTAMYPLVSHHYSPYDEAIERNATVPDVNFPISLDVSIWLADFETKPVTKIGR